MQHKFSAKTVDEATEIALRELDVALEDMEIKVVSPGRSGILGLGGEMAVIEVKKIELQSITPHRSEPQPTTRSKRTSRETPKLNPTAAVNTDRSPQTAIKDAPDAGTTETPAERDAEVERLGGEVLNYLLQATGVKSEVYVREESENGYIVFEIEGEDAGALIGIHGSTMQAIQHIVRALVSQMLNRASRILIDIGGYREQRSKKLWEIASQAASRVTDSGRLFELAPMSPADRRIVHMALADNHDVKTESEGVGRDRRVVIFPQRDA